tara:strand:- start:159 stop:539 length:381 start_codon:yes stop_codon:yes gene_type:complete
MNAMTQTLYLAIDWDGDMAWLTPVPYEIGELLGYNDEAVYDIGSPFCIEGELGEFITQANELDRGTMTDVSHGGAGAIAFGVIELSTEEAQFFQSNGAMITSAEDVANGAAEFDDELECEEEEDYA